MDKTTSNIVKGIAILFMLWLHLFNQMSNVEICHTFISINGTPLVYLLTKAANPVAFFLIVSGYGLYHVNRKGDPNRIKRLMTLLVHYWIVLLFFIIVGHILQPDIYPGSIKSLIENFTTYHTTYNGEMWFLCPYIILALSASIYFKFIDSMCVGGVIITVVASYILYIGQSWFLGRFLEITEHFYWIRIILNLLQLQFNFTLGAIAAKINIFGLIRDRSLNHKYMPKIAGLALVVLIWFQCIYGTAFYAIIFITLVNIIKIPMSVTRLLQKLGHQSMNIWLIHTWICYYLFHDFIYDFRYPIIIFTVLLIISYIIAIGVDKVSKPIENLINNIAKPIT